MSALTEKQKIEQMRRDEADRLAAAGWDLQIIKAACEIYGYDFEVARRTYVVTGEPEYVRNAA